MLSLQLNQHPSNNWPRESKGFDLKIDMLLEVLQGSACLTKNKADELPELTLLI